MSNKFEEDSQLGKELMSWWKRLQDNKGDRAEFCRADNINEILMLPAFYRSCSRFKRYFDVSENWEVRLAAILGVLAHVREQTSDTFATRMAGKPKPKVSELRFRRLLQKDRHELFIAVVRILRMTGRKANLYELAGIVYFWGPRIKRQLAFEYFEKIPVKSSN